MAYEFISWRRFERLCGTLYRRIADSGYTPDLIIAIARGGYPVARLLADYFGIMALVSLKIEHYRGPDRTPNAIVRYPLPLEIDDRRVLLVDDVSDSGDTFTAALHHLREHGTPAALRTAVLHHKLTASLAPDYHAQRIRNWRWITYPWAIVEDLTVLASRCSPAPVDTHALARYVREEIGLRLPSGVLAQIAPIVLERLRDGAPR